MTYPQEIVIKTIEMYQTGSTPNEIAKKMGISVDCVRDWVKDAGYTLRPREIKKRNWAKIRSNIGKKVDLFEEDE